MSIFFIFSIAVIARWDFAVSRSPVIAGRTAGTTRHAVFILQPAALLRFGVAARGGLLRDETPTAPVTAHAWRTAHRRITLL
jgi:hypothetical protein